MNYRGEEHHVVRTDTVHVRVFLGVVHHNRHTPTPRGVPCPRHRGVRTRDAAVHRAQHRGSRGQQAHQELVYVASFCLHGCREVRHLGCGVHEVRGDGVARGLRGSYYGGLRGQQGPSVLGDRHAHKVSVLDWARLLGGAQAVGKERGGGRREGV